MLTIALLAALSACNKKPGSLSGKITDKITGAPIEAANVQLNPLGLNYVTSGGQYGFLDVKAGKYALSVTKTGYIDITSSSIRVKADNITRHNMQMTPTMPVLSTQAGTNIDYIATTFTSTATLNGTIIYAGDPAYTERGFVYDTSTNPDIEHGTKQIVSGSDTGRYSATVTGLLTGSAYYVRAYATNSHGTAYGNRVKDTLLFPNIIGVAGFMMQKQDIGQGTWYRVDSLCNNSTLDGFTDWRLPTVNEMDRVSVIFYNNGDVGEIKSERYWCIDKTIGMDEWYGYVSFNYEVSGFSRSGNNFYGRCVRTHR
ncbi:hypothetical protein FACS1894201_10220 [Bacteroidia bacterium]|nr:hypothetical protein FACS1894201_10220 [Bacteroidia bacterium]